MRFKMVLAVLARLNFFVGLTMAAPVFFAWQDNGRDLIPIATAMGITVCTSGLLSLIFKSPRDDLSHREGMMIVALGWASAGLFGALPFFISKILGPMNIENFINCFFESISGFTTTGASVLGATVTIESLGRGILFWRSLTHWLGGMGIIVLVVAILPLLGVGGMQLFRAEAPGPTKEKLRPRIRETAATLWLVYVILSAVETALLVLAGMSLFDALCQTFGTISGGGFSTRNASIAAFHSGTIDVIIIIFMLLGGTNFSLHYLALSGKPKAYWYNSEFRYFIVIVIMSILIMSAGLFISGTYESIIDSIRYGSFQVVSIITTTGYSTADFELWPIALQLIILTLMFFGSCSGSTSGSIKIVRIVMLFKYAYREIFRLVHPKSFAAVKLGGKVVHKDVLESIAGFFILYMVIFVTASILMGTMGMDIITSLSSVATTLGNIGPGLGTVGPTEHYFGVPLLGKIVLIFCMILGRLEVYTVLILLVPEFWKK